MNSKLRFVGSLVSIACFCLTAGASAPAKGLLLKIDFQKRDSKKKVETSGSLIIPENNNDWTPLLPAKDGVALLGKFSKPIKGIIKAQYMVVDLSQTPVEVHQMSVVSQVGVESEVKSETGDELIGVKITATESEYK